MMIRLRINSYLENAGSFAKIAYQPIFSRSALLNYKGRGAIRLITMICTLPLFV